MRNNKLIQGGAEYKTPTCVAISLMANSILTLSKQTDWVDSDNFMTDVRNDVFGGEL